MTITATKNQTKKKKIFLCHGCAMKTPASYVGKKSLDYLCLPASLWFVCQLGCVSQHLCLCKYPMCLCLYFPVLVFQVWFDFLNSFFAGYVCSSSHFCRLTVLSISTLIWLGVGRSRVTANLNHKPFVSVCGSDHFQVHDLIFLLGRWSLKRHATVYHRPIVH